MFILEDIIKFLCLPESFLFLFVFGSLGIGMEMCKPGSVYPGLIGGILLFGALWGFLKFSISGWALFLVFLSLVLFFVSLSHKKVWLIYILAVSLFIIGTKFLIKKGPEIHFIAIILSTTGVFLFFLLTRFRKKERVNRKRYEALIGEKGKVVEALNPRKVKVEIMGELWKAISLSPLNIGSQVQVLGFQGLSLLVMPSQSYKKE
jgi:membrane-bound ClpP family serine protease